MVDAASEAHCDVVAWALAGAHAPVRTRSVARLRHRVREQVHLNEVAPAERPLMLKRYLELAPGARAHILVDRSAPLSEFERIARSYPVFRVVRSS